MSLLDIVLGKPLANSDERGEQIGVSSGIPIFGLDALSSAAYGPEAALTLLIPLGAAGVAYILPVSASTQSSPAKFRSRNSPCQPFPEQRTGGLVAFAPCYFAGGPGSPNSSAASSYSERTCLSCRGVLAHSAP